MTYYDITRSAGYWPRREKILQQLQDWGYEPKSICSVGISEESYLEYVQREGGRRVYDTFSGESAKKRVAWRDPLHGQYFVRAACPAEVKLQELLEDGVWTWDVPDEFFDESNSETAAAVREQLEEWGYDPDDMNAQGLSNRGYLSVTAEYDQVLVPWRSQEHYEFLMETSSIVGE